MFSPSSSPWTLSLPLNHYLWKSFRSCRKNKWLNEFRTKTNHRRNHWSKSDRIQCDDNRPNFYKGGRGTKRSLRIKRSLYVIPRPRQSLLIDWSSAISLRRRLRDWRCWGGSRTSWTRRWRRWRRLSPTSMTSSSIGAPPPDISWRTAMLRHRYTPPPFQVRTEGHCAEWRYEGLWRVDVEKSFARFQARGSSWKFDSNWYQPFGIILSMMNRQKIQLHFETLYRLMPKRAETRLKLFDEVERACRFWCGASVCIAYFQSCVIYHDVRAFWLTNSIVK